MCWYFDSSNCHCFREKNRKIEQRPTCLCPGVSTHVGAHSSSILWLQGHPALIFLPQDFFSQIKHFNAVAISSSALQHQFSGIQKLELRLLPSLRNLPFCASPLPDPRISAVSRMKSQLCHGLCINHWDKEAVPKVLAQPRISMKLCSVEKPDTLWSVF